MATNRWGLNKKNSVGPVSQWIRECGPERGHGGKVFIVFSIRKEIYNPEIIEEIKKEIQKLKGEK